MIFKEPEANGAVRNNLRWYGEAGTGAETSRFGNAASGGERLRTDTAQLCTDENGSGYAMTNSEGQRHGMEAVSNDWKRISGEGKGFDLRWHGYDTRRLAWAEWRAEVMRIEPETLRMD